MFSILKNILSSCKVDNDTHVFKGVATYALHDGRFNFGSKVSFIGIVPISELDAAVDMLHITLGGKGWANVSVKSYALSLYKGIESKKEVTSDDIETIIYPEDDV